MSIRISHATCLKPRLLGRSTANTVRIEGVLTRSDAEKGVFVDAIDFDGEQCRYRQLDREATWLTEQDGDEFQSCAQTIMDRLRTADCDDAHLSIIDSVITETGALMVAVRNEVGGQSRWLPLPA